MADAQDGLPADNRDSKKKSWNSSCKTKILETLIKDLVANFLVQFTRQRPALELTAQITNPTRGTGGKGIVAS